MTYNIVIAVAIFVFSASSYAGNSIESRRIYFAKGTSLATVQGTIKGRSIIDYKLAKQ